MAADTPTTVPFVDGASAARAQLSTKDGSDNVAPQTALRANGAAVEAANPLPVVDTTTGTGIGAPADSAWASGSGSVIALLKGLFGKWSLGHGTAAAAVRVELPTDGTGVVGLAAGSATIGALTANQSMNVAQIAGATAPVGHGVAATALRVELPTDGTGKVGLIAGSALVGYRSNYTRYDQCCALRRLHAACHGDDVASCGQHGLQHWRSDRQLRHCCFCGADFVHRGARRWRLWPHHRLSRNCHSSVRHHCVTSI